MDSREAVIWPDTAWSVTPFSPLMRRFLPPRVTRVFRRLASLPDWVIGLVLAIAVTLTLYFVFGVGDDPTLAGG